MRIRRSERRRQDYLRQRGLKTCAVYERRLLRLRRASVRALLKKCRALPVDQWATYAENMLSEPYLYEWFDSLYLATGMPQARSTARDLSSTKDSAVDGDWERAIRKYAQQRAGENVVSIEQTFRESFVEALRAAMDDSIVLGVEALTDTVLEDFCGDVLKWQVRRIARTETMISLGKSADIAARSLGVRFTKTWSISGVGNTRDSHLAMDGKTVMDDEFFILPDGSRMLYPHDSENGAPAGEIINCACTCIRRRFK